MHICIIVKTGISVTVYAAFDYRTWLFHALCDIVARARSKRQEDQKLSFVVYTAGHVHVVNSIAQLQFLVLINELSLFVSEVALLLLNYSSNCV